MKNSLRNTKYLSHYTHATTTMISRFATHAAKSPVPSTVAKKAVPSVTTASSHLQRTMASTASDNEKENVILLGAAGRDFHDFITYWSVQKNVDVKCFTGAQIPGIDRRTFPKSMCNNDLNDNKYPDGVKIYPESELEELIDRCKATTVALAYSDLSYDTVQSLASRANASGCKFVQLPPKLTMVESTKPVISVCASRTGVGKSQTTRYVAKVSSVWKISCSCFHTYLSQNPFSQLCRT